jgi:hypothetical protein
MPKITIDNIDYNTEDLTENGRAQLSSLQFLEGQMQKIRQEIAVYQTAQAAYAKALKAEIAEAAIPPVAKAEQTGNVSIDVETCPSSAAEW